MRQYKQTKNNEGLSYESKYINDRAAKMLWIVYHGKQILRCINRILAFFNNKKPTFKHTMKSDNMNV